MRQMESCGCVTQKSSLKKGTLVTVNSSRKAERLRAVCTVHHSDLLTSFLILSSKTVGI